jgi:hypothetical protein
MKFSQKIFKIGINPCVVPPEKVLRHILSAAGKDKGPIPVRGTINSAPFVQTLVKYQGAWRLYINGVMLRSSGLSNGNTARIDLEFDPQDRTLPTHPLLAKKLGKNRVAKSAFDRLAPHRQKEINRYLASLKTRDALARNLEIVMAYLQGKKPRGLHALLRIKKE